MFARKTVLHIVDVISGYEIYVDEEVRTYTQQICKEKQIVFPLNLHQITNIVELGKNLLHFLQRLAFSRQIRNQRLEFFVTQYHIRLFLKNAFMKQWQALSEILEIDILRFL
jgi:ABC-type uncharacterized transport system ATPase subunit